ncbi:hypothetical protein P7H60_14265 [Vagococcus carniphilus]|uniref:Uncharacterized protein n=1 Tax=Vagococcus carniphilus TaxID=218144 RepID=A0AAW8U716_9ENTE|nr:hypothetical protein [Vagococcus carniphilus]MDT2813492.1 hypothetical protein [Vagococcus carniphilus]MDT2830005.1 hypothetical protein [Vagococcus carniphilus]MDT2833940.1 hypothetical protein [Vagococcus carniphilus]MDT2838440.1 hypothetical protein [Vagococcus carniphilus]MDT2850316.1 hypothetical protein [Vagococcus carniphilus]
MNQEKLKSEKIREKNDSLRKKGKDPLKGWIPLVHHGFGVGGSASGRGIDTMGAAIEDQKNSRRK